MVYSGIPEHEDVLTATERITLVTARPGRGKTTLAIRVAERILSDHRIRLEQRVLLLTFSRSAVHQIEQTAHRTLPEIRSRLWIATYHSFAWWLLTSFGRYNGLPKSLDLLGDTRSRIAREFAEQQGIPPKDRGRFYANLFKGIPYEEFIPLTLDLLTRSNTLTAHLRELFPAVLVDEFQDTSEQQWRLISLISNEARLVCFADPDQLIYRWRGAKETRLEEFVNDTHATTRPLQKACLRTEDNELLNFAEAVLDDTPGPSEVRKGRKNRFLVAYPGLNSAGYHLKLIIRHFHKAHEMAGRPHYPTIACAAYSNLNAKNIKKLLAKKTEKAPYTYNCTLLEMEQDEAVDELLISLAEWASGGQQDSLERALQLLGGILFNPKSGIVSEAVHALLTPKRLLDGVHAATGIANTACATFRPLNAPAATTTSAALERAMNALTALRNEAIKVKGALSEEELKERYTTIARVAAGRTQATPLTALRETRRNLASKRLQDTVLERTLPTRGVTSLTLHKLKGRQYDYVIIVTVGNDTLRGSGANEKDSRRLLYVALTRAIHDARILYVKSAPAPLIKPYVE